MVLHISAKLLSLRNNLLVYVSCLVINVNCCILAQSHIFYVRICWFTLVALTLYYRKMSHSSAILLSVRQNLLVYVSYAGVNIKCCILAESYIFYVRICWFTLIA